MTCALRTQLQPWRWFHRRPPPAGGTTASSNFRGPSRLRPLPKPTPDPSSCLVVRLEVIQFLNNGSAAVHQSTHDLQRQIGKTLSTRFSSENTEKSLLVNVSASTAVCASPVHEVGSNDTILRKPHYAVLRDPELSKSRSVRLFITPPPPKGGTDGMSTLYRFSQC